MRYGRNVWGCREFPSTLFWGVLDALLGVSQESTILCAFEVQKHLRTRMPEVIVRVPTSWKYYFSTIWNILGEARILVTE